MNQRFLSFALLSILTPLSLAQSDGWGQNCPLRTLSNTEQRCGPTSHAHNPFFCNSNVTVTPPSGDRACTANITDGRLRIRRGVDPAVIFWKLNNPRGQAKFDETSGITILTDPDKQTFGGQRLNDKKFQVSDLNSVVSTDGREITYEAHVWWRADASAEWQKCCPIDPKIVNDGP